MILCITEKPSVAKDIAAILGANVKRDGYYEGGNYKVTWTFGHLCELKEPHDYTERWKSWSLSSLPMIPQRFEIKIINQDSYQRQMQVITTLAGEASEIINCGDAGQEGEVIQRWVMQKAGVKCPVKRLWISSLTDDAIRDGFAHLQDQSDFQNLYYAGLSRAIGDWILGMNATRLYTLKYSVGRGNVLSIGRVQTPTLALIVKRQLEIDHFVPEDYWELRTEYKNVMFNSTEGKYASEKEAADALEMIKQHDLTVTDVVKKKGHEAPPRLFDLTTLQVECNKKWGWTADETLKLIQTLYEKKVTTYPRVDTTYLSEDIYPKVPDILKQMTPYASLTAPLLAQARLPKSKKIFDNSKVTDHHAIIPTGVSPTVLYGDEKKLYHMIALRFIAAFYPDCEFEQTTINATVADCGFKATGKVIVKPGWRVLYEGNNSAESDSEDCLLPPMTKGEAGSHVPQVVKKTTTPPKFYTEGTLLRAMEGAGRTVDDEELREALKENGIGRPSTRSSIIETLFKRRYIKRVKKSIQATEAGISLISIINEDLLKSARLTGIWENKLRRIERGDYSAADFIAELKTMIAEIVLNVMADNTQRRIEISQQPEAQQSKSSEKSHKSDKPRQSKPRAPRVTRIDMIKCPHCGEGHLLKGKTAYGCSRFREGCKMLLPFSEFPADLTPGQLNSRVKKLKK